MRYENLNQDIDDNYELKRYLKNKEKFVLIGLALISSTFFLPLSDAWALPNIVTFDPVNYNGLDDVAQIKVDDPGSNLDSGVAETITVHVWSTLGDPVGVDMELKENGIDTGIFKSTALVMTKTDNQFSIQDTTKVFLILTDDEALAAGLDPSISETFDFPVISTTDPSGTIITLTETGANTQRFESKLKFSAVPSSGNIIQVNQGDVVTVIDTFHGTLANFLIIPTTNTYAAGLRVNENDDIHVIFQGIQGDGKVSKGSAAGGGSGGGLLRPGFVLDIVSLVGGASGGDFLPPQLVIPKMNLSNLPIVGDILDFITNADPFSPIAPLYDPSIDYPLSINGNGYLLTQYANTIQTYTEKTGEPVSFKMTLFDATGVEHIGLYTNLRGDHREIQDSDTFVIYHENRPLEITDPNGFFSNVNFTESEYNGKYLAEFDMTFAKPMDTSDVIIRTWDERLNSGDIKVFDAIKIEGEPIVNPDKNNLIIPDSADIVVPYYKLPHYEIPNADAEGNLIYYNSFGGLEEKKVNPYHYAIIYPEDIGKNQRNYQGFDESQEQQKLIALEFATQFYGEILYDGFKFHVEDGMYPYNNRMDDLMHEKMIEENQRAIETLNKQLLIHQNAN